MAVRLLVIFIWITSCLESEQSHVASIYGNAGNAKKAGRVENVKTAGNAGNAGNAGATGNTKIAVKETIIGTMDRLQDDAKKNLVLISGWACVRGRSEAAYVHLYVGGPKGTGHYAGPILADQQSKPAIRIPSLCPIGDHHAFKIEASYDSIRAFSGQLIFAYGSADRDGNEIEIGRSGAVRLPDLVATETGQSSAIATPVAPVVQSSGEQKLPSAVGGMQKKSPSIESVKIMTQTRIVATADKPDPHVVRVIENGRPVYYLTHTVHNGGDFPIYRSENLTQWNPAGSLFQRKSDDKGGIVVNGFRYCWLWAPEIAVTADGSFQLSFTAGRFPEAEVCPDGPHENTGVYLASASRITGPYAIASNHWEPLVAAIHPNCQVSEDNFPRSLEPIAQGCQGRPCHRVVRLDGSTFHDRGRWWMAYAWYTNIGDVDGWEAQNYGEHVSIAELDPTDPFVFKCDQQSPQLHVGNPHNGALLERLRADCDRSQNATLCRRNLSFTTDRHGNDFVREGRRFGVVEAPSVFRHGDYVYLLQSGSTWDSPQYHVYWTAAKTVEGLHFENSERLVGRFVVPSRGHSFGHGTPIQGAGKQWVYIYHHLNNSSCRNHDDCGRDVIASPITFEDRGDGKGPVYIKTIFPAEDLNL